jgi:hypothetical protein
MRTIFTGSREKFTGQLTHDPTQNSRQIHCTISLHGGRIPPLSTAQVHPPGPSPPRPNQLQNTNTFLNQFQVKYSGYALKMVLTNDAVLTIVRHYALPLETHKALLFCIGNACLLGTSLLIMALIVRFLTACTTYYCTAYYCTTYYNTGCKGNV